MRKTFFFSITFITALTANCFAAMPRETGFYVGTEHGASALNNDVYIYTAAKRTPDSQN